MFGGSVLAKPIVSTIQLVPLFEERKMPPPAVPAKRTVPETARTATLVFVNPEFSAVQFAPLLVERKTPPFVAENRFVPETARELTVLFVIPESAAVQITSLFCGEVGLFEPFLQSARKRRRTEVIRKINFFMLPLSLKRV